MSEQNTPDQEAKIIQFPVSRVVGEQAIAGALDTPEVTPTDERLTELLKEPLVWDFRNPSQPRNPNTIHRAEIERLRWQNNSK